MINVVLGFDFGLKRIGVAIGQSVTKSARALLTLNAQNGEPKWEEIKNLIQTWQPDALIVGIPLNMDGSTQVLTAQAKLFSDRLQTFSQLPVYGMDERLSTKDARERLFNQGGFKALKKGEIDKMAAQLILQNWLDLHVS